MVGVVLPVVVIVLIGKDQIHYVRLCESYVVTISFFSAFMPLHQDEIRYTFINNIHADFIT